MKRLFLTIIPVLIYGMVLTNCGSITASEDKQAKNDKKETASAPFTEGKYSGTFTVKYFVEMPASWGRGSGNATIEFKNGKFTSTGNPNRVPAGGSGSYSINNNRITFNDELIWSSDFEPGLVLSGVYEYTLNGKKLKLIKKYDFAHYEYDLEKQ